MHALTLAFSLSIYMASLIAVYGLTPYRTRSRP